jgi:neutral ceramidase
MCRSSEQSTFILDARSSARVDYSNIPMRAIRILLIALAFGIGLRPAAPAADVSLRVGAAREDITPDVAVLNWVTGKPYGVVRDPLHVHALVLDDGRGRAVLIRWDLVDVSESARDHVRKAVGAALNVPPDFILVHASHTHSAPWAPVYGDNHRGRERETWWAIRHMPPQNEHPPYQRWMARLIEATVGASKRASAAAVPATVWMGRVAVNEFLHNRRPRAPAWGLAEKPSPPINYSHREWNPEVLQGGATFGPMDRTLSLVSFRDAGGAPVASLFHVACHSVSIYPTNPAISADWPGAASAAITGALGGESLFVQGCAGDINPWRRGDEAVAGMAAGLAAKAQAAARYSVRLAAAPLQAARTSVDLPLTPAGQQRVGAGTVAAEIQAITCGPLAIVALPGEPMTEIGLAIRERSPFPQTLVLGYSNGNGVHYVGMPGEKARGGYEAGQAGAGTEEAGLRVVEGAARLLSGLYERSPAVAR